MAQVLGETTITARGQISLPARGLRDMDWHQGDHLIVQRIGEDIVVLVRRPSSWTEAYAGKLTALFRDHEDVLDYVRGERADWGQR